MRTLIVELAIALLAGFLMGISEGDSPEMFQGTLQGPYALMSPGRCLCDLNGFDLSIFVSKSLPIPFPLLLPVLSLSNTHSLLLCFSFFFLFFFFPLSSFFFLSFFCGVGKAPNEELLGQSAYWLGVSIGVIASPPGVVIFGGHELVHFHKEAQAGHSRLAYFLAKTLATLPRVLLSALHFSGIYYFLVHMLGGFEVVYAAVATTFLCVYSVAQLISILLPAYNTALIAVIFCMALASVSGQDPSLSSLGNLKPALDIFYARWVADSLWANEVRKWTHLFDVPRAIENTGYNLESPWRKLGYAVAIATVTRVFVFFALAFKSRRR